MRQGADNAAAGDTQRLEKYCKSRADGKAEAARTSTAEVVALLGAVAADRKCTLSEGEVLPVEGLAEESKGCKMVWVEGTMVVETAKRLETLTLDAAP